MPASEANVLQRWMDFLPLWLGAGIAFYFQLPREPSAAWAWTILPLIAASWFCRTDLRRLAICLAALSIAVGFACAIWQTQRNLVHRLDTPLGTLRLEGRVREIVPQGKRLRITLDRLASNETERPLPDTARISVALKGESLAIGERIGLRANLSPIARPAMPGAFDFGRYFYFRGIGAVGYGMPPVEHLASSMKTIHDDRFVSEWMTRQRLALKRYFLETMDGEQGRIAAALVTGDQSLVSEKVSAEMRVAGLTHILAISGMHMTIVCGFVYWIVRFVIAGIALLRCRIDARKTAALVAIVTGSLYLWLADFPISAVRAHVMIVLYLGAILLGREADTLRSLVLAAVFIFLVLPSSLLEPGFQLSFAAVLALIVFYRWREKQREKESWMLRPRWWKGLVYPLEIAVTTLVATAATAPIAAYHFHQFAPYGLLANMLAIPLATFIITPLMLLAIPAALVGLDPYVLHGAGWGIEGLIRIASAVDGLPGSIVHIPPVGVIGWIFMTFGGLVLLRRGVYFRAAGAAVVMVGLLTATLYRAPDLLLSADGKLVALHEETGWRLLKGTRRQFVAKEWENALGFEMSERPAERCDREGCIFERHGKTVALPRYVEALVEDCAMSRLVLAQNIFGPARCRARMIDRSWLDRNGSAAVSFDEGRIVIRSSCDATGDRPWTRCPADR